MAGKSRGRYTVARVREHAQRHVIVDLDGYAPVADPGSGDAIEPARLAVHYARTRDQPWQAVGVTLSGVHGRVRREIEWAAEPISTAQIPLREAPRWLRGIVAAERPN
ncbi:hypothetical protein [Prauserella cavernicola]|uniref:Uncharacterized protein n=1 Tax=Prauserella cavernicola TaxID=2800127 RepID=A0A934QRB8_9PSEU|nr:hypothetical protein [Prauserella cavernicola]MBK1785150.1 hypothetical protein [Prauserella cavernicola]